MRLAKVLLASGLLSLVLSCGSTDTVNDTDVNEDKIWGRYNADFDANTKALKLTSQFRLGGSTGTTIRLTDPSKVTVNDTTMSVHDGELANINLSGTYYQLDSTVDAPAATYTYKWTRKDGQTTFTNVLTMAKPVAVEAPAANATVSRAGDFKITFAGDDILPDESVSMTLRSEVKDIPTGKKGFELVTISSGKEGIIPKANLAEFVNGAAKIEIVRNGGGKIQSGHDSEGGAIYSYYRSTTVAVTVVD